MDMAFSFQLCQYNNSYLLAGIDRPQLLNITAEDKEYFGCDQDWYQDSWQQRAGCGPCTASSILLYLALRKPQLRRLYPHKTISRTIFAGFMHQMWSHVTPGIMGVNEGQMLIDGLVRYAGEMNIHLEAEQLKVPGKHQPRLSWKRVSEFVRNGLDNDCPVAFLNLSNGNLDNLDSWHWVTITALFQPPDGEIWAIISDSGEKKAVALQKWYESTLLGGSFVVISRVAARDLSP